MRCGSGWVRIEAMGDASKSGCFLGRNSTSVCLLLPAPGRTEPLVNRKLAPYNTMCTSYASVHMRHHDAGPPARDATVKSGHPYLVDRRLACWSPDVATPGNVMRSEVPCNFLRYRPASLSREDVMVVEATNFHIYYTRT